MTAKYALRRVALAVVVVGLAGTAWALTRTELGAKRARAALVQALGTRLGGQVQLEQVELSLAERRVRARGVRVRAAWGAVVARELSAPVSWLELLRGEVAPDAFELRGAEVELDLRDASAARAQPTALRTLWLRDSTLTLRLRDGVATLSGVRLDVEGEGFSLRAARASVTVQGRSTALGQVELAGRRHARGLAIDSGRLTLGGVSIALAALELSHPLGQSARGRLRAEGALGPLLALGLPGPAERLEASGVITGSFALGPEGRSLSLDAALTALRLSGRALAASATLHAEQSPGTPGWSLRAQLERGGGEPARQLEARLEPSAQGFALTSLQLRLGGSTLTGHAELAGERLQVELAADDAAIADVAAAFGALRAGQGAITGRGRVALRVQGALDAPELALQAELGQGALLGTAFERATLSLRSTAEPSTLAVESLSLRNGKSRVSAEDLVVREREGRAVASGELRVEQLPLAELWRLLGAAGGAAPSLLQGEADGRIALSQDERGATRVAIALSLRGASLHGLRFAAGALEATLEADGRVALSSLSLRDEGSSLTLAGAFGGSGALDVRGELERLPLSELVGGAPSWLALTGTASGSAIFTGKLGAPDARIEVTLDELALLSVPLGKQPLRAELASTSRADLGCDAGSAPLELASLRAAGSERAWMLCGGTTGVRASLALGVGAELPLRGRLAIERADLSGLLPARAPGKPLPARASFALDVTGGGLRAPGSLSFVLAVRELQLGDGKHTLTSTAPFELRGQHGALALFGGELWGEHTRVRLGAEGTLPRARLTAKGTIAAAALLAAAPVPLVTEAFGEVAIDAALPLDGSPAHLRLEPQDAIAHLGAGIVARKVRGSIALEPDGVRLDDVSALVGGGTLRASGTLRRTARGLDGYDLALTAQDVSIEPAQRFTLGFDADVHLRSDAPNAPNAPNAPPLLSGRVRVERFVYGRHIELPEALIALNVADRRERASYDPARDHVAFDLELEQAGPLVVRNRMIDAELRVQGEARRLRLVGTDQRFGLIGGMEVERGRVLFHGDEFEIARGAVSFGEATRVAPVFELRAIAKKRTRKDASIVLEAKGDRETFSLDVRCDAGGARVLAPPFACAFARDQLRCDRFEQLVNLWSCPVRTELSQAGAE